MSGISQAQEIRTVADLIAVLAKQERLVLQVEGIRAVPVGMGRLLAERWFAKH